MGKEINLKIDQKTLDCIILSVYLRILALKDRISNFEEQNIDTSVSKRLLEESREALKKLLSNSTAKIEIP